MDSSFEHGSWRKHNIQEREILFSRSCPRESLPEIVHFANRIERRHFPISSYIVRRRFTLQLEFRLFIRYNSALIKTRNLISTEIS